MKYLAMLLCCVTLSAQGKAITELGITFPIKSSVIKNYVSTNGVSALPLTSGYSSGVEIGRHGVISNQATVGVLANANMFLASDSTWMNQIYQLDVFLTGRLYFDESWRGGVYAELGAGPEFSAAKFKGAPLVYQINIGARFGVGYNYKFTDDVTIGIALVAAPSLTMSDFMDGVKVRASMLW